MNTTRPLLLLTTNHASHVCHINNLYLISQVLIQIQHNQRHLTIARMLHHRSTSVVTTVFFMPVFHSLEFGSLYSSLSWYLYVVVHLLLHLILLMLSVLQIFFVLRVRFHNKYTLSVYIYYGIVHEVQRTLCLKKVPTFLLSVTLSNLNRFSHFLHC